MYIEFPDGEEGSVDWDDWPNQCFLFCDATFPYADGSTSCPATLSSPLGFDLQVMQVLDAEVERVIFKILKGDGPSEWPPSMPEELKSLIQSISDGAKVFEGELERDSYVDLAAYKEYLGDVVDRSPTFMTETHAEDEGYRPGSTSAYRLYWDSEPSEAIARFIEEINKDVAALKAV
jgi:hypothetical protein